MPDAYQVYEGRYIVYASATSAANALLIDTPAVPRNTVWTILSACCGASVDETNTKWFSILDPLAGYEFVVTLPASFAGIAANYQMLPCVREGMEMKLFPGEKLRAKRSAATAGSTFTVFFRYIVSDLPIYEQYEPQVRRAQLKRSSSGQRSLAGGGGVGGGGGEPGVPEAPPPGGPGESIPGY